MLKRAIVHATHGDNKRQHTMPRAVMVERSGNFGLADEPNLLVGTSRKAQKLTKSNARLALHGAPKPPPPSKIQTRTFLEERAITSTRLQSYEMAWMKLVEFAEDQGYPMTCLKEVDAAAAWWMDMMYFEGDGVSGAMTMMAAIKHMRTDVPKLSLLVRCSRSLRAFKKLAPPMARVPLPFPMLAQVVKHIVIELTEPMVGVHLILTWSLCCRPGESLKLKWRQIVAPNQVNRRWSVLLSESSPVEGQSQPSKTHELDEAVLIDHPYLLWLGAILKHLKKGKRASMPVFDFKMAHVSSVFGQALDACGYRPHGVQSVYQIRHGSASTDRLTQQRSMEELMKRGRWRSLSSLRRYEQGGRISHVFGCLSPEEQKAALMAEKQLPIILGRCVGCSKLPNAASSLSFSPGLAD